MGRRNVGGAPLVVVEGRSIVDGDIRQRVGRARGGLERARPIDAATERAVRQRELAAAVDGQYVRERGAPTVGELPPTFMSSIDSTAPDTTETFPATVIEWVAPESV